MGAGGVRHDLENRVAEVAARSQGAVSLGSRVTKDSPVVLSRAAGGLLKKETTPSYSRVVDRPGPVVSLARPEGVNGPEERDLIRLCQG